MYICHFPFAQTNRKHKNALLTGRYPGQQAERFYNKQKTFKTNLYLHKTIVSIGNVAPMNIRREQNNFHDFV